MVLHCTLESVINKEEASRCHYHGAKHEMGGCCADEYAVEQECRKPAKGMASTQ